MKNKKNVIISILTTFSLLLGFTTTAPTVLGAGSGAGGGGTGGGGSAPAGWFQVWGNLGTQGAWSDFWNRTTQKASGQTILNRVQGAGNRFGDPNLLQKCQNSKFIWYYSNGDGTEFYTQTGDYGGTNTAIWYQGHPSTTHAKQDWDNWIAWGGNFWNGGRTVIICSGQFEEVTLEKPCPTETKTETSNQTLGFTGTYSTNTSLAPQARVEYPNYTQEELSLWHSRNEPQEVPEEKSSYGKWFDANKGRIAAAQAIEDPDVYREVMNKLINEAKIEVAKGVPHPEITLSEKNRKGFADGGTINITEGQRKASFGGNMSATKYYQRTCTMKNEGGNWVKQYSSWKLTSQKVTGRPSGPEISSRVPSLFWQIMHAKCNENGVREVVSAKQNELTNISTIGTRATDTVRSIVYDKQSQLPLADSSKSNPLRKTAYDSFYNETAGCLAIIDCVSDPVADAVSDNKNNIQDRGTKRDGNKFGAQGEAIDGANKSVTLSSDTFTFFRDNDPKNIRLDIWYPRLNVNDPSVHLPTTDKSLYTRILMDPFGTPTGDKSIISVYKDILKNKNASPILNAEDITAGKGYNIADELNNLQFAATWASDGEKPHRVNADWVKEPTITNVVYEKITGNGEGKGVVTNKSKIRTFCELTLNTKGPIKPIIDTNKIALEKPPVKKTKFDRSANKTVNIYFVRSGAGLNQR